MLRRAFALLLIAVLVLGWAGEAALAAAVPCAPAATASAADDPCQTCGETDDRNKSSCPALGCVSACAAGAMAWTIAGATLAAPSDGIEAEAAPSSACAVMRALRPDHPPPR